MEFNYSYNGSTAVNESGTGTEMSFSPDVKRQPTYFVGELRKNIAFREAISALHDVVVSDLRFKPKDRTEYQAWRSQQDDLDWQLVAAQQSQVRERMEALNSQLQELYQNRSNRWSAFYKAQRQYYNYLYKRDYDMWFVLDPVITVHPDEVFFECFSQDESSYGRLGASYEVFHNIREFACGTTNIDYSAALYNEFQKIRSYKNTLFQVDPSGFEVQTTREETYKEVKIDLPDSWVRGFLQVSSAMSLPAMRLELQPMDVYNICLILRRYKEKQSPRGMRYHLTPGESIKIVFEPWEKEIICSRSPYTGNTAQTIRVWGRRRLLILERLLPIAKKFTVHLLGTGMPSFYVADLGDMSFTLGLSGWSANDWSGSGNFDLMTSRVDVDALTQQQVFAGLKENWAEPVGDLAKRLNLDRSVVLGALSVYTQAGRAIYDLNKQVYRVRELSREPLPMERLRFANEREEKATRFLENDAVRVTSITGDLESDHTIQGTVRDRDRTYEPHLVIDSDRRLVQADCTCNWFQQNKLYKGPCEHMLALRMQCDRQRR
ncbi:MAG: SWIM zinc finger family protein [Cyanobacteria bacterium P01_E01_bin.42]